ncbi:MAG TPA: 50S ribosomal protein L29 [Bdellovibrionales bacterium]|nr:50S ribosomal protein L29 [Bdellovibrionales bacterium]
MKFEEVRGMSVDELKKKLRELREQLFELGMKNKLGQVGNPIQIRFLRRDVARVKTALNQKLAQ